MTEEERVLAKATALIAYEIRVQKTTNKEVAKKVGVSENTMSAITKDVDGKKNPRLKTIVKIMNELSIDLSRFKEDEQCTT